jgi:hypothetical protein
MEIKAEHETTYEPEQDPEPGQHEVPMS